MVLEGGNPSLIPKYCQVETDYKSIFNNNFFTLSTQFLHLLLQLSRPTLYIVFIRILSELHILHQYLIIRTYLLIKSGKRPNSP